MIYNKRGVSDYALYDEAGIEERTGVRPDRYVQYAALRGDNSDNLPGVPGVGEKTAAKLINTYGDVEGIYAHVADQTPKLRENLGASEDIVRLNVILMDLERNAPIEVDIEALFEPTDVDEDAVKQLFDFLEFRTLYERMDGVLNRGSGPAVERTPLEVRVIDPADADLGARDAAGPLVVAAGGPAASSAKAGGSAKIEGLGVVADEKTGEVFWVGLEDAAERLGPYLADGRGLVVHDAKPVLRALHGAGIDRPGLVFDTALAAYLVDPAGGSSSLENLLETYTDAAFPEESGPPEGQLDFSGEATSPAEQAGLVALATARVAPRLEEAIADNGLERLNREIEVPLVGALARMEAIGVGVDVAELESLNEAMTAEAEGLASAIHDDAGEVFNVNSTKKLQEILFGRLGLTPGKKTKTGFSTDQATLEKLEGEHPIVEHLLRYREVEKLRSTYGEALLSAVADDGRIHATFNQMVARTGRLSSENPNLHNIPVRSEMGRQFRRAFVPAAGFELLVADYNQIELRCIAHLAEDPGLIEAFTTGVDVHRAVAGRVFGVAPDEVNYEQRSRAKMVSYGLAYGMEAYGLGQRLGIPTSEAAEILDSYFAGFPSVKSYMEATVAEARNRGYTETLFGRRRMIPELMSDNFRLRQAGERQAMNAGIQGLAADIFKVALVRLDRRLQEEGVASRLVLQVHDEVILEVPPEEKAVMTEVVLEEMSGAFDLAVPLDVDMSFGQTWAEAKD